MEYDVTKKVGGGGETGDPIEILTKGDAESEMIREKQTERGVSLHKYAGLEKRFKRGEWE